MNRTFVCAGAITLLALPTRLMHSKTRRLRPQYPPKMRANAPSPYRTITASSASTATCSA